MANKITNTDNYTNIANAIRNKNGSTDTYTPAQMAQAILDIPSGGGSDAMKKYLADTGDFGELDISDTTMTKLRDYALYLPSDVSTTGFSSIKFPATLTEIGANALFRQTKLLELNAPNVQKIGNYGCRYCNTMERVYAPNCTTLGQYSFDSCNSLVDDITLGAYTTLPMHVFSDCRRLERFTFSAALATIENYAFDGCDRLDGLVFPATLTTIGKYAFRETGITTLDLPATLQGVNERAFYGCASLKTAKIRSAKLGESASVAQVFNDCTNLENVWISANVVNIYASAARYSSFLNCSKLTDIYCEAAAKPSGWGTYWNYTTTSAGATIHWGTTEEQFDEIVAGS